MATQNQRELPADLARGRERLAAWRRTKKPRSRIPEALWEMAVKLAAKHGVHRTSRTLKLDYYSLKKRALAAAVRTETQDETRAEAKPSSFVELPSAFAPIHECGLPAVLGPVPECVIELEDCAGSWRVHLKGYRAADIAAIGRSLRGSD